VRAKSKRVNAGLCERAKSPAFNLIFCLSKEAGIDKIETFSWRWKAKERVCDCHNAAQLNCL